MLKKNIYDKILLNGVPVLYKTDVYVKLFINTDKYII